MKQPLDNPNIKETMPRTILVVEDDDLNFNYIDIVMELEGLTVLWAKNGVEAIALFDQHPEISIILMDIRMPAMDGYEATRQIRTRNSTIPIIAITAFAQLSDKEKSLDAGCNDYLSKPVRKDDLLKAIYKHLPKQ
ncbi:response regulator [Williamwhitmania taraxaci]|uniref:CheY chemotaxis protein or a CheY-like REC (Receiver) domain n=1 Tax=Williamwhitmania taraxaci TaxID=1640674 RepID=A0A1G6J874_9BACT|nr:response regulator [Williamwhitmania taraxaci]SDC14887.1 CheY chemotaxis protein or a CheY-like REC (receiver) domain [Williamwhitmania taraxaci]